MLLEERRAKILAILIKNERVLVNNLAELFSVSKETIRRDLSYLEKIRLLNDAMVAQFLIKRMSWSLSEKRCFQILVIC